MSESAKLAEVQYRKDEKKAESESVNYPDWIYRAVRQRPLLVLFHLDIKRANIDLDDHAILPDASVVAWSISRSEEHTSELQSLMRISYAVFCLKKKKQPTTN